MRLTPSAARSAIALAAALGVSLAADWRLVGAQVGSNERTARVEGGLLPRAVAPGQLGRRFSIAERMAYHGVPGMSLAVVEDGQIIWSRGYGVLSSGGSPVTSDTVFQAGSLSKPVTAIGALALIQRGELTLDGDVRQRLQSWQPDQRITLRQLLSHSAGISVPGFSGYVAGATVPSTGAILKGQSPANNQAVRVTASPGSAVNYSGGGYVVIQQLIEDVTKQPFHEYMRTAVLAPLGMTASSFDQPRAPDRAPIAAVGHRRNGERVPAGAMVHPELAAAGLWSTAADLAQVLVEMQNAMAARPARILTAAMGREMLTGQIGSAGLGVFLVGPNGSSRRFTHSGRNAGFDARIVGYKNGHQGAVVMINRNNNGMFIDEVLESIAREYRWPDYLADLPQVEYVDVPSSVQASYAGVYETAGQPRLVVVFEDDKLFARNGDDEWTRLYPASPTEFFTLENRGRWMFERSEGGPAIEVVWREGATVIRRRRV